MKKLLSLAVTVLMVFTFVGCGETEDKNVDLKAVMTEINSQYANSMTEIEDLDKLNSYYSVEKDDVESFAAELDQSGIDEIILIKAANDEAVSRIETCLNNRYNAKIQQGASYSPEELSTIKSCTVEKNGQYVSLIVSEQAAGMREVYNNAFA